MEELVTTGLQGDTLLWKYLVATSRTTYLAYFNLQSGVLLPAVAFTAF